jgi:hypothetical protein
MKFEKHKNTKELQIRAYLRKQYGKLNGFTLFLTKDYFLSHIFRSVYRARLKRRWRGSRGNLEWKGELNNFAIHILNHDLNAIINFKSNFNCPQLRDLQPGRFGSPPGTVHVSRSCREVCATFECCSFESKACDKGFEPERQFEKCANSHQNKGVDYI